jgi:hypothetical protein
MRVPLVGKAALIGLLVNLIALFTTAPVDAATTETVVGTATTSGGNGISNSDFVYSTTGILGSGTIHNDFVLSPQPPGFHLQGTGVMTRSDGATLSGTLSGTVDLSTIPVHVTGSFIPTSGTGGLAGVTGEILSTGDPVGPPGSVGHVFTLSGTLTIPSPVPTDKEQCKNGGWQDFVDDQGEPFPNQGQCVSFVEHTTE